jgi:prepilin-type N-terminal cleavage/methylation domain-containing protein
MKKISFTLIEVMIVVSIIAILAIIAIPNLLRPRITANETSAKSILKTISSACESYAASNSGNYPTSVSDLTSATPTYLNEDYTSGSHYGYTFSCGTMISTGYSCVAIPVACNRTGTKVFTITTGSIFSETSC